MTYYKQSSAVPRVDQDCRTKQDLSLIIKCFACHWVTRVTAKGLPADANHGTNFSKLIHANCPGDQFSAEIIKITFFSFPRSTLFAPAKEDNRLMNIDKNNKGKRKKKGHEVEAFTSLIKVNRLTGCCCCCCSGIVSCFVYHWVSEVHDKPVRYLQIEDLSSYEDFSGRRNDRIFFGLPIRTVKRATEISRSVNLSITFFFFWFTTRTAFYV